MRLSRRKFVQGSVGAGALLGRLTQTARAADPGDFRAAVGIFLFGGHDGWNMAVPTDARYEAYLAARGPHLALPRESLLPLGGTAMGLHPSLAPLARLWADGALSAVLNTGALKQPMTKALYLQRPDLRPAQAMLHAEAETHWGREGETISYLARIAGGPTPALYTARDTSDVAGHGAARVDRHFHGLTSDLARQLNRAARMIERRDHLGDPRQAFLVSHYGYDTHADQVAPGDPTKGRQADLYADLAGALQAFYAAMDDLGLARNVTAFTMSEFGRSYKANWERGTEHGWGNNHLVLGGAAMPGGVRGIYPTPVLGGPDDVVGDGRWLPSLAVEEYLAPIARWYGVPAHAMATVFPHWSVWDTPERRRAVSRFA